MHVVIDGVFFQYFNTGIARVWQSIISEWIQAGYGKKITVLNRAGTFPAINGINIADIPAHDYANYPRERDLLQNVCNKLEADIFISTYYTSTTETPYIAMAHDMIPEVMGMDMQEPMWQEKHFCFNNAKKIICVSENTRKDLLEFLPDIKTDNIHVVHNGLSPRFTTFDEEMKQRFRKTNNLENGYFLHIGSRVGYKNGETLFNSILHLPPEIRQNKTLFCTGNPELEPEFTEVTDEINLITSWIDDRILPLVYAAADVLIFPSFYEGFGLPVLEAMACGCPVIASDIGALKEIAGDAAVYVTPDDPQGFADSILMLQDNYIREKLIEKGIQRSKEFSWHKTATKVWNILKENV